MTLLSCKSKPLFQFNFDEKIIALEGEMLILDRVDLEYAKGLNNSSAIKVSYVGNEKGSRGTAKHFRLSKGVEEATLNYSVKFAEDFQFRRGGKMFGLAAMNVIRNHMANALDGWNVRVMFKPKVNVKWHRIRNEGKTAIYIYSQEDRPLGSGNTTMSKEIVFTKGVYSNVSLYIKVNTPATASNGIVELWVDGKLAVARYDMQYRAVEGKHTLINKFIFSTFHGGKTPSFAPKDIDGNYITVHAWFKNIQVYEGKHITKEKREN